MIVPKDKLPDSPVPDRNRVRMRVRCLLRALWSGCLFWLVVSLAPASVLLPVDVPVLPLTAESEFWFDVSGQADFSAAIQAPFSRVENPNFGNSHGALWLRVEIENPGAKVTRILRVGPAMLERVEVWQPNDRFLPFQASGLAVPMSKRLMPDRQALFPVTLAEGRNVFYLRLSSPSKLNPELGLWESSALQHQWHGIEIGTALLLGGLMMTGFMTCFYAVWMREWLWILFGGAVLSYDVYLACYEGFAVLWLWPEWPRLNYVVFPIAAAMVQILVMMFMLKFIPPVHLQRGWKLLWALPFATAVGLSLVFLLDYRIGMPVIEAVGAICALALPPLSLAAFRSGFKPARYILLSVALIYGATLLRVGMLFGWWSIIHVGDPWLMPLSALMASALFLLAVMDYLRELRAAQLRNMSELAAARESADRANRAKNLFLARVSHDLRTPLQVLTGYLELGLRDGASGFLDQSVSLINNSVRAMLSLIDELLQFARGEEGRLELNPKPTLLHAWFQDIAAEGRFLAETRGNRFVPEVDLPFNVAVLDAERLRSVLVNLLSNAGRLTSHGSITLSMVGRAEGELMVLDFAVSDTGPGIALADQECIFEPFEQGGKVRQPSTGLGLAICRQLVGLMGGELGLKSIPGHGATFYFSLSVPLAAEADVFSPVTFNAPLGYEGPLRSLLVVDDVDENRLYLQDLLTGMGFDVLLAGSVAESRLILRNTGVDGAIVDQYLPDGTGWEILDDLKNNDPDFPVVLLSAAPALPPAYRTSGFRFDAELLKPVRVDVLTRVLGLCLRLVWRTEAFGLADRPLVAQGSQSGPLGRADLMRLRQAAYEGDLFAVEEWFGLWRASAPEQAFLDELEPLISAVKFSGIVELVDRRLGV